MKKLALSWLVLVGCGELTKVAPTATNTTDDPYAGAYALQSRPPSGACAVVDYVFKTGATLVGHDPNYILTAQLDSTPVQQPVTVKDGVMTGTNQFEVFPPEQFAQGGPPTIVVNLVLEGKDFVGTITTLDYVNSCPWVTPLTLTRL